RKIQIEAVGGRKFIVDAVEHVLLISAIVKDRGFGRIKKAPSAHAVNGNEIAPFLSAVCQVKAQVRSSETAVRSSYTAMGLVDTQSGAGSHFDHQAGFVAELGRRSA